MTFVLFIISFLVSAAISVVLIRLGAKGMFIDDADGVQKYHNKNTPRIGGVAIFVGMACSGLYLQAQGSEWCGDFWLVMLSALPIFCGGAVEDYTKRVRPFARLSLALISTAAIFFLLDVQLHSVRIPIIDAALSFALVSFLFTLLAVSGLTNSINIIDGYNGLSGVVSLLIISALLYISLKFQNLFLMDLCVISIGTLVGFLVWNYPYGLIFLGDSGAYFIGFIIAVISIMLVNEHPEVSPWFPLLLCIYPVWETVFSMFRRKILQRRPMSQADALHLHTLIYRRILHGASVPHSDAISATLRNSMTSVYLWIFSLFAIVPAAIFWNHTIILGSLALCFIVLHLWLYFRIIRFKAPRFLNLDGKKTIK